MTKKSGWSCRTVTAKVGVSKIDKTPISSARVMGGGALVMSMLSTKTPTACLPKRALLNPVTGCILIALEAVWEGDIVSSTLLAKHGTVFQTVFSFFDIRWTLGGENAWYPIITGWKKESGGGRGASGQEVLLKASANCTRGEASFHS